MFRLVEVREHDETGPIDAKGKPRANTLIHSGRGVQPAGHAKVLQQIMTFRIDYHHGR